MQRGLNPPPTQTLCHCQKKRIYHNSKVKLIICIMAIDQTNAVHCRLNTCWGDYKQFLRCLSGPVGDACHDHVDLSQLGPSLVCYVRMFVLWERCHMVSSYSSLARLEPRMSVWPRQEGTWQPHTTCGLKHTHTHTVHWAIWHHQPPTHRPVLTLSRCPSHLPVYSTKQNTEVIF